MMSTDRPARRRSRRSCRREEWEAARQQLLVKEKELTRARDALAAERRRMPWLAVREGVRVRRT